MHVHTHTHRVPQRIKPNPAHHHTSSITSSWFYWLPAVSELLSAFKSPLSRIKDISSNDGQLWQTSTPCWHCTALLWSWRQWGVPLGPYGLMNHITPLWSWGLKAGQLLQQQEHLEQAGRCSPLAERADLQDLAPGVWRDPERDFQWKETWLSAVKTKSTVCHLAVGAQLLGYLGWDVRGSETQMGLSQLRLQLLLPKVLAQPAPQWELLSVL